MKIYKCKEHKVLLEWDIYNNLNCKQCCPEDFDIKAKQLLKVLLEK